MPEDKFQLKFHQFESVQYPSISSILEITPEFEEMNKEEIYSFDCKNKWSPFMSSYGSEFKKKQELSKGDIERIKNLFNQFVHDANISNCPLIHIPSNTERVGLSTTGSLMALTNVEP